MKLKIKTYITPKEIQKQCGRVNIVYTIECYRSNRIWEDDVFAIAYENNLSCKEYIDCMKLKFDCIEYKNKLFYKTKQQCEDAIKFIEYIKIMKKLSQ